MIFWVAYKVLLAFLVNNMWPIIKKYSKGDRIPTAPGKPGKMMKAFPVMEISWNFEILQNIMEK